MENRPIKFRAWDEDEERFVYSDKSYDEHWFEFLEDGPLKAFGLAKTAGSIDEPPGFTSRELEPVQEFTGLHDRNGKEIWEGDIVFDPSRHGGKKVVQWNGGLAKFQFDKMLGYDLCQSSLYEVIGNIYENPEPLKEVTHESINP